MNIFFIDRSVKICARYHVDRHVVKMILETVQLLCTAIWVVCGEDCKDLPCKPTHKNHPSAVWARANQNNWMWLKRLGIALCEEYTFRYEKEHKLEQPLRKLVVPTLPDEEFFQPPQAMPDEYKDEDSVVAYRKYYRVGKAHLHYWKSGKPAWKKREIPFWI